jgi:hypothetical protein
MALYALAQAATVLPAAAVHAPLDHVEGGKKASDWESVLGALPPVPTGTEAGTPAGVAAAQARRDAIAALESLLLQRPDVPGAAARPSPTSMQHALAGLQEQVTAYMGLRHSPRQTASVAGQIYGIGDELSDSVSEEQVCAAGDDGDDGDEHEGLDAWRGPPQPGGVLCRLPLGRAAHAYIMCTFNSDDVYFQGPWPSPRRASQGQLAARRHHHNQGPVCFLLVGCGRVGGEGEGAAEAGARARAVPFGGRSWGLVRDLGLGVWGGS